MNQLDVPVEFIALVIALSGIGFTVLIGGLVHVYLCLTRGEFRCQTCGNVKPMDGRGSM